MDRLEQNKQTVACFWAAFSECRIEDVLNLLHDNATWWVAGDLPMVSGTLAKDQCGPMIAGIASGTQDGVHVTPGTMTAEEDRVAMEATSFGITVDGIEYRNTYHMLHVVRDGKILSVREYMDPGRIAAAFPTFTGTGAVNSRIEG
ncbi:MAG TPA: nuclear transport factor 2 family protein [Sphingopyxis sp.]|nr:nuclear transport factor 2 family protein [Sphingopyxis sp.]